MSIIRVSHNKENPYVLLNKKFLEGSLLSLRAKGLLAYLLSKPDNWTIRVPHLIREMKEGRDAIQATLKELEIQGYLVRSRAQDKKGKFRGWETIVFETPQQSNLIRFPEKPSIGLTVNRFDRQTENPHLVNKELVINDFSNKEIKEGKEKPKKKTNKRQEYQEWCELANRARLIAGPSPGWRVVTLDGCLKNWEELATEHPLAELKRRFGS